jgi:hypothetical protein
MDITGVPGSGSHVSATLCADRLKNMMVDVSLGRARSPRHHLSSGVPCE